MGDASKYRLFAAMVDNLLAAIVALVVAGRVPGPPDSARWGLAVTVYLAYYVLQEGSFGTTLGKRLFGLSIVRLDGGRSGWGEAAIRTLLRVFEVNPLLLGGLPAGLAIIRSKKRQRLGDRLARTLVVRRRAEAPDDLAAVHATPGSDPDRLSPRSAAGLWLA